MATINGTAGNDTLSIDSGTSNNILLGLAGNDILNGLTGGGGNTLNGGDGDDTIFAKQGDTAIGGAGDDVIVGGLGGNTLTGGLGQDIFELTGVNLPTTPNTITDFNRLDDNIQVNLPSGGQLTTVQAGNNAIISFGGKQLAIVQNTLVSALTDIIVVNNETPTAILKPIESNAGLLQLSEGVGTATSLLFTKISHKSTNRNQLGVFTVDDDNGKVNGILPGQSGYLAEVLKRSQVVFSALGSSVIDTALDSSLTRNINLPANSKLGFYLAVNGTVDDSNPNIFFSFPSANNSFQNAKITQPGGITQIAFEDTRGGGDGDLNDLVIQVQTATNPAPLGIPQQGIKEIFDLTAVTTAAGATFEVKREASFDNHVGFYRIEDIQGSVKVGNALIKPGEDGYRQAVFQNRLAGIDLTGTNGQTLTSNGSFQGGAFYAPFLISNANTANADFSNVYTAYSAGNADKADRIRLLGDNTFGFEDLVGGGDRDFNDLIVKATFQ